MHRSNLKLIFTVSCLFGLALTEDVKIKDFERECPEGFFYSGEVEASDDDKSRDYIEQIDKSPVYSCYKFIEEPVNFVSGSAACDEGQAHLLSVDGISEELIVNSEQFRENFPKQISEQVESGNLSFPILFFTSGIQLAEHNWTWFGSDQPIDESIVDSIENSSYMKENNNVQCLAVRWSQANTSLPQDNTTQMEYTTVSCLHSLDFAICEVHVYTVTWRVWFFQNWLKILFLLTVSLLILFSCCIFINVLCNPNKNGVNLRGLQSTTVHNYPPPYSPNDDVFATGSFQPTQTSKYMQKSKELLAKVKSPLNNNGPTGGNINWQRMTDA